MNKKLSNVNKVSLLIVDCSNQEFNNLILKLNKFGLIHYSNFDYLKLSKLAEVFKLKIELDIIPSHIIIIHKTIPKKYYSNLSSIVIEYSENDKNKGLSNHILHCNWVLDNKTNRIVAICPFKSSKCAFSHECSYGGLAKNCRFCIIPEMYDED